MRRFARAWALIGALLLMSPLLAAATEPEATPAEEPLPPEIIPTEPAPSAEGEVPAAPGEEAPAPSQTAPSSPATTPSGADRFGPAPARGIQPTVSRLPSYWQCQDDLTSRVVVTYLDTEKPSIVLERGGKKVIATRQRSGSGVKYMAPGGILFWERGREATLQWGSPNATSCTSLGR